MDALKITTSRQMMLKSHMLKTVREVPEISTMYSDYLFGELNETNLREKIGTRDISFFEKLCRRRGLRNYPGLSPTPADQETEGRN